MSRPHPSPVSLRRRAVLACSGALLAGAWLSPGSLGAQSRAISTDFTGPPGSSKPSLTASPDGNLLLSWFEPRADKVWALRIATQRDGKWSPAQTVIESDRFFVNWADFPSAVETSRGEWLVHWLEKTEAKPYAYHVRLSSSSDRGRTWSAPITAHGDRSPTEHGFVAMLPDDAGQVAIAWLDGYQTTGHEGSMSLRTTTWQPGGTVRGETQLDGRTCECCQVSMARTSSGLIAAYRDRSDEEVRDIAVVRQVGGEWSSPTPVHRDEWVWRACPVNGPDIDAVDQNVVVGWFTAAGGPSQVKAAFSTNGGATFGKPVPIDLGDPLGRVQVALIEGGAALVLWLEVERDAARWMVRRVSASGEPGRPLELGATARTRTSGFGRAVVVGQELFAAWSDPGPGGQVRVVRLPISRIPLP